ncbi:type II toxin-antitoxin system RelE/ParE family toxin [Mediterraneibacter gnavus]|uniref:type II toxin-antitoxin system RelE/ParE family toxin n=1 Tax=Mediterraneibacter gnavus TaxID=33038 RepID=UPI001FA87E53|nr:type II toxin-antitoxin system RelE/ParE family toxin [Mediterraneibacter gnavus]
MDYKGVVTAEAEEDLNQFVQYLLFAKKNKQAAKNVLDDFEDTIKKLKNVASSLKVCDNSRLQSLGYRRINFQQHRYFMLYRIENDIASGRIAEAFLKVNKERCICYARYTCG